MYIASILSYTKRYTLDQFIFVPVASEKWRIFGSQGLANNCYFATYFLLSQNSRADLQKKRIFNQFQIIALRLMQGVSKKLKCRNSWNSIAGNQLFIWPDSIRVKSLLNFKRLYLEQFVMKFIACATYIGSL